MEFKQWLITELKPTSGKTGLYALGYGGIGLYPLQYLMPVAADAIHYVSIDDRLKLALKDGDGNPWSIHHLPD